MGALHAERHHPPRTPIGAGGPTGSAGKRLPEEGGFPVRAARYARSAGALGESPTLSGWRLYAAPALLQRTRDARASTIPGGTGHESGAHRDRCAERWWTSQSRSMFRFPALETGVYASFAIVWGRTPVRYGCGANGREAAHLRLLEESGSARLLPILRARGLAGLGRTDHARPCHRERNHRPARRSVPAHLRELRLHQTSIRPRAG